MQEDDTEQNGTVSSHAARRDKSYTLGEEEKTKAARWFFNRTR